jgi:hypothetical protein
MTVRNWRIAVISRDAAGERLEGVEGGDLRLAPIALSLLRRIDPALQELFLFDRFSRASPSEVVGCPSIWELIPSTIPTIGERYRQSLCVGMCRACHLTRLDYFKNWIVCVVVRRGDGAHAGT